MTPETRLQRYIAFLENLDRSDLEALGGYVTENVSFRDPFHDTAGLGAMRDIFEHMFNALIDLRFQAGDRATYETGGFFSWSLSGQLRGKPWRVEGVSVVEFAEDGRVSSHRDYWDAASQLYEHFPVIGPLLRLLKRRVASR